MEYPQFLAIGNWLFMHLRKNSFEKDSVGGACPENIYIVYSRWSAPDLSRHLRTYEGLVASGATEPTDNELLRLLK